MPIAIQCDGCKQRLRVPDKVAGKRVKCPKCQAILRIPALQDQRNPEDAEPPVLAPSAEPESESQPEQPKNPKPSTESRPSIEPQQTVQSQKATVGKKAVKKKAVKKTDAKPKSPIATKDAAVQSEAAEKEAVESTPERQQERSRQQEPSKKQVAKTEQATKTEQVTTTAPARWYLKTEDGEDYGPVPKAELDQWMDEGRITADCHVLQDGADQWQWASDVYPQLEAAEEAAALAGPPPLKVSPVQTPSSVPVVAPATVDSADVAPDTFQFAAADTSPTLRARGRKRVRKVVKKGGSTRPTATAVQSRPSPEGTSPKSKLTAGLLGIFLGAYGVHRFYLGYTGMGLVMLFTCGGCGIWSLIDAIMVLMGKVPDAQGRPLRE